MLLEGLHIPLTTPFHSDGRLNTRKLASNIARYSKTPAAGLIILGPNAEPTLLSDDETREALRTAAEAAAPEKVLIAGIVRDSVRSVLDLADFAAEQHYDAILVNLPFILDSESPRTNEAMNRARVQQVERRLFFLAIADRSPLPVILLHEDHRVIRLPEAGELASHSNIIGILGAGRSHTMQRARISGLLEQTANIRREVTVTSTFAAVTRRMRANASASTLISIASPTPNAIAIADLPYVAPALRTRTKSIGFQTIAARTDILLDALNTGAIGIAPAFAAAAPQACYEVFAAWKDGDHRLAEEKQSRIREAAAFSEASPAALKYACDLNGYFGGLARQPHLPLTGEQRNALEECMKDIRN